MSFATEIQSLTSMGLKSVPTRLGTSLVIVVGVAIVVLVLVSALALAQGFQTTAARTGRPDRAIVLNGADEGAGNIKREQVVTILNAPGIRKESGRPVASAEALTFLGLTDPRTNLNSYLTVRGVGAEVFHLRPEIRIVEGRAFSAGAHELLIGRGVHARLGSLTVGAKVPMQDGEWTVSGIFESGGDARESEALADADTLLGSLRRNVFNSVSVALENEGAFETFRQAIESDPTLEYKVHRESEYFERLSRPVSSLLTAVAMALGVLMSIGAIFAALNTMYTAVATRWLEIATLRALGFGSGVVALAVLTEALVLSLVGAVAGALLAWLLLDGAMVSAMTGFSASQLTFGLHVTPHVLLVGGACAILIAIVGGALAAVRAARIPVSDALRLV